MAQLWSSHVQTAVSMINKPWIKKAVQDALSTRNEVERGIKVDTYWPTHVVGAAITSAMNRIKFWRFMEHVSRILFWLTFVVMTIVLTFGMPTLLEEGSQKQGLPIMGSVIMILSSVLVFLYIIQWKGQEIWKIIVFGIVAISGFIPIAIYSGSGTPGVTLFWAVLVIPSIIYVVCFTQSIRIRWFVAPPTTFEGHTPEEYILSELTSFVEQIANGYTNRDIEEVKHLFNQMTHSKRRITGFPE